MVKASSASDCCSQCALDVSCNCWDFNPTSDQCYTKQICTFKVPADRVTGKFPPPPPTPPMPKVPPQSAKDFNDTSWLQVNAPHDMLIAQPYAPTNTNQMAFIARNVPPPPRTWPFTLPFTKPHVFQRYSIHSH